MKEPQGDVESGSAPVLQGVKIGKSVGHVGRDVHQVFRSDPRRQQTLVSVSERGVHQ